MITDLIAKNIKYELEQKLLLDSIDFELKVGEIAGLAGLNGSGKTTLCKILLGLIPTSSGEIYFSNKLATKELLKDLVYFIFQNPDHQIVGTLVRDDIAFSAENKNIKRSEMLLLLEDCLKKVNLSAFANRPTHALSGGQKQRLAIAGALMAKSKFLILDEPFAMLDPKGRLELSNLLLKLTRENEMGILIVSHHASELAKLDKLFVIYQKKLKLFSPALKFFQSKLSQELGFCEPNI